MEKNYEGVKTVDCTPTWEGLVLYMLKLHNGNPDGRLSIEKEFLKMAQAADKWNAHCKEVNATKQGQ